MDDGTAPRACATYELVKAEVVRMAHVDDMDVCNVLRACHEAWETYYLYSHTNDPSEAEEGSWSHFLAQELGNKTVLENLLLATLVYSRKDSVSKALLGQAVLDICVQAIVKYPHDDGIVRLASQVINEITPASRASAGLF